MIEVEFKIGLAFKDKQDFSYISDNLKLQAKIVPQKTQEEEKKLEVFASTLEATLATFSVGNLVLNIFLSLGLKYLWNMVTLL